MMKIKLQEVFPLSQILVPATKPSNLCHRLPGNIEQ